MFETYRNIDASLLIRTDFSDDLAWRSLCDLLRRSDPRQGFQASFILIDDPEFAKYSVEMLARQAAEDLQCAAIFVADAKAIGGTDHAVLCVDCVNRPNDAFRVTPEEVWAPENNLRLANMDFAEFANSVGQDGIFRSFQP